VGGDDGEDQQDGELDNQLPRRCVEAQRHGRFVRAELVLKKNTEQTMETEPLYGASEIIN
jgi:hypothetical protein